MLPASLLLPALLVFPILILRAAPAEIAVLDRLAAYDVAWKEPGPSATESMPLGNGDIGLNVWTEPNGDVLFYISKTDAWSENVFGDNRPLLKLGRVRISLDPPALAAGDAFSQTLRLGQGEIVITEGDAGTALRVWVDANRPVVHVEMRSSTPRKMTATLETWRTAEVDGVSADTIVENARDGVLWYHQNNASADAHVANRIFGALMKSDSLERKDANTLASPAASTAAAVSIHALTEEKSSPDAWRRSLEKLVADTENAPIAEAYKAHLAWWAQFWNRSWIFVSGNQKAEEVTQGYVLQRFITACAGRGAYPIKFNGSIFTVDFPQLKAIDPKSSSEGAVDADFRTWGGQYWFQNTRAMYWPRLAAGDYDMMMPLFEMYAAQLEPNARQVKEFYKHGGAYFAETAPFWGGLKYAGPELKEDWTLHYFLPIIELGMMMLDFYDHTGDQSFAKERMVPTLAAALQFYDEHFPRDAAGKLLLEPVNSIETYWKASNPAPDIAGLRAVLPRMIALPDTLVTPIQRRQWQRLLSEIPELPIGERKGRKALLPYHGEQNMERRNGENPELYAIFPFRLYGINRPDLELARTTFEVRDATQKGCWVQDPVQAAIVGLTGVAEEYVHFNFVRKSPVLKFPAFWETANDYAPDQDNGGMAELGLQKMLMQTDGRKILLLPAWPKEWSADFKLHAPYGTTVEGRVEKGRLVEYTVTPSSRRADVVDLSR